MDMQKQIEEVVEAHNEAWLSQLVGNFKKLPAGLVGQINTNPKDEIDELVSLGPINSDNGAAVCAVIDGSNNIQSVADDYLVLAVGINYGQGNPYLQVKAPSSSAKNRAMPSSIYDDTTIRKRLGAAFQKVRKDTGCKNLPKGNYDGHLVVGNFFPFITKESWSALRNSIQEAILFKKWGWSNPTEQIESLVKSFYSRVKEKSPDTKFIVVFHGANNAVPVLGIQTLSKLTKKPDTAILCDNLAHGNGIKNAELL